MEAGCGVQDGQGPALDRHFSRCGTEHAGQDLQQGGLAASVGSNDAQRPAGFELEADVAKGPMIFGFALPAPPDSASGLLLEAEALPSA